MTTWASGATFYHIYPLGMLGAPADNPGHGDPVPRIRELIGWTGHLRDLGVDAVYLGPVFESSRHGYDTTDHFMVDRRLGTDADLRAVVDHLHGHGIRVILDAVYHHVGREHFAFRDLREHGEASVYRTWFHGLDFSQTSPLGDPFTYDGWNGVLDLVKLDVTNHDVREHLFAATGTGSRRSGSTGSASTPPTSSTATSSATWPRSSGRSPPTPGCSAR